jgi:hypothetical protein
MLFTAVGCPDFQLPPYADMKREGDRVIVTCQANPSSTWERKCVGTQWIGEVRTCPELQNTTNPTPGGNSLPIGTYHQ